MGLNVLIGTRDFKQSSDIIGIAAQSEAFNSGVESVDKAGTLLIFENSNQHTWLVCTSERLYCLLDDVRKPDVKVNWFMNKADIVQNAEVSLSITARPHSDRAGLVNFGKNHQNWYYSYRLFADQSVEQRLKAFIGEHMAVY